MSESEVLGTEELIRSLYDKLFDNDELDLYKDGQFNSMRLTKTKELLLLSKKSMAIFLVRKKTGTSKQIKN